VLIAPDGVQQRHRTRQPIRSAIFSHRVPATGMRRRKTQRTDEPTRFNWRTRNVLHLAELGPHPISLYDPQVVRTAYLDLQRQLITASSDERERLLSDVRAQLRPERSGPRLTASWEELGRARELHPGIEIGVQTRNQVDLSSRSAEIVAREILDAMADVRDALGIEALDLAYPFNRQATRGRGAPLAEIGGRRGPEARVSADTDRFAIPRIDAPQDMSSLRLFTSQAHPFLSRSHRSIQA
jgi:hypothetical protein